METSHIEIVILMAVGFGLASFFGFIAEKLKLPSLLGYLLSGYIIGPYSPGYSVNLELSEQLAEIGVILMLFSVGLNFKLEDLNKVKNVAIPGAIGQTFASAAIATLLAHQLGLSWQSGIIIGFAVGVASTVVVARVLEDNQIIQTVQGHIALGWLVVEDIFTVGILLLLPVFSATLAGGESFLSFFSSLSLVFIKFFLLAAILFTLGHRFVSAILINVARTRSHELFTLTVLALVFLIATVSALGIGTSLALGAFIAGMVIGQTDVRHQAFVNSLPLKDSFAVIFFLSVGMLFNPQVIGSHLVLFLGLLGIILLIKPVSAFLIVIGMQYSVGVATIVALALAQIGEFSFILAEEAMNRNLIPDEVFDILVACSLISIAINTLLFNWYKKLKQKLESYFFIETEPIKPIEKAPHAIIVGYGPIGRKAADNLSQGGYAITVIDKNIDTIRDLKLKDRAIFGDAASPKILERADIHSTGILILTAFNVSETLAVIHNARYLNPDIKILARTVYLTDADKIKPYNVKVVCSEEETLKAFEIAIKEIAGLQMHLRI